MKNLNLDSGEESVPELLRVTRRLSVMFLLIGIPFAKGELGAVIYTHVFKHLDRDRALVFMREITGVFEMGWEMLWLDRNDISGEYKPEILYIEAIRS